MVWQQSDIDSAIANNPDLAVINAGRKAYAQGMGDKGQGQGNHPVTPAMPSSVKAQASIKGIMLEINLNHLPFRELSPNSRCHYMVKARAVRATREELGWLAKSAWGTKPAMKFAVVSYEFYTKGKRHRDIDNLIASMKPALDGLVDAGVILGDDSEHITLGQCNVNQSDAEQTIIRVSSDCREKER